MPSSEQILEDVARDGNIDIAEWPRVLEDMLKRLHDIVHNDFPQPSIPLPAPLPPSVDPEVVTSTPPRLLPPDSQTTPDHDLPDADSELPSNSQSSTKENDAPADLDSDNVSATVPGFRVNHTLQGHGNTVTIDTDKPLPPELLNLYNSSTRILERDFASSPPYTIQRLAEMVLYPRKHYRYLPSYLRAIDRIVSVSSPVSDFPLSALQPSSNGGFLTNGDVTQANGIDNLGSDESLGGALLTPIPWLRADALNNNNNPPSASSDGELHSESTDMIDGPNGTGSIETVSVTVNGVSSAAQQQQQQQTPSPSSTSSAPSSATLAASSMAPTSPTLSEQSDASSSSSSGTPTDALLREQGGLTQGELLRQEQEAGIFPVAQPPSSHHHPRLLPVTAANANMAVGRDPISSSSSTTVVENVSAANFAAVSETSSPPLPDGSALSATSTSGEKVVHASDDPSLPTARGPEVIGMEDMGPQPDRTISALEKGDGGAGAAPAKLDIEAAVGRRSRSKSKSPGPGVGTAEEAEGGNEGGAVADVEGDWVVVPGAQEGGDVEMGESGGTAGEDRDGGA